MSWCNNHTEESCIHDYTFSVSHFQRKLDAYYGENKRPPLLEAYFMTKTPRVYQKEVFLDSDCAPPLIMAFLLVAEARLDFVTGETQPQRTGRRKEGDQAAAPFAWAISHRPHGWISDGWFSLSKRNPNAMAYFEFGLQQLDHVSADQRFLLENTDTWPLQRAIQRVQEKEQRLLALQEERKSEILLVDFVMVHCKEKDLSWLNQKLRPNLKWSDLFQEIYIVATPDPSFVARGDECSAYLSHITYRYDQLADYTFFIHSDPGDHLHFSFLSVILKSLGMKTFDQGFMHLNGPRHVRTMTPCIQAIAERIFGHKLEGTVGPYCCAQFVVSKEKIYSS
eukprot:g14249.t1